MKVYDKVVKMMIHNGFTVRKDAALGLLLTCSIVCVDAQNPTLGGTSAKDAADLGKYDNLLVWNPNKSEGEYLNPIIYADYSDPDICAVGGDYYMTASSFCCVPGLPVLHSKDLVNWNLIGYALNKLVPEDYFNVPRHGKGVWAPAIRYHAGEFYIYWGDPDYGIYMVKTKNPCGEWEEPVLVKSGKGMIDPAPLWDDDGKAYLVHAWAGSRAQMNSVLSVWEMSPDGTKLTGNPVMVYDGYDGTNHTVEGPKFYKRDGYYYIFAPAGGVEKGWQLAMRSKNIYGPYESRVVMAQGATSINGPHQGGWVETPAGECWFVNFQDKGAYGRVAHLNPMQWKDGWPVIGVDSDGDGCGEPVSFHKKPVVSEVRKKKKVIDVQPDNAVHVSLMSDEFNTRQLGLQWQWMANYQPTFGFTTDMGVMRLYGHILSPDFRNFWEVPNLLLQKFAADEFSVVTKLKVSAREDGQRSGLIVMGHDYCRIGVVKEGDKFVIEQTICNDAEQGGEENTVRLAECPYSNHFGTGSYEVFEREIYLRVDVREGGVCKFSYSMDGDKFVEAFTPFKARVGKWIGAKVGLYSVAPNGCGRGWLDVDWFRVTSLTPQQTASASCQALDENLAYCDSKVRRTLRELHAAAGEMDYSYMPRNIAKDKSVWHCRKTTRDEWCSGFWPGVLWYDYECTGDSGIRREAERFTRQLEYLSRVPAFDHDLGFLIFCSYGNAYRLTGKPEYKQVILDTADTLATLFNPNVGTILSWPRNVKMYGGHNTIMDNMINLEMLFWAAKNGGDKALYDIAVKHAEKTMNCHFRPDGTSYHVAVYDPKTGKLLRGCTHQGYSDSSMWARGQSWAIYGYTMVYRETRDRRFLDFAQKVTDVYLDRLPEDYVPYWDFNDPAIPNAPRDASAAAVVASALIELSGYVPAEKSKKYLSAAKKMLMSLSSDAYQSRDKNSAFLLHSVGHKPAGSEIDASIIYADYYYIEALTRMKKLMQERNI